MDDSRRRRNTPLALQREFTDSRLEKQILMRAFAMLVPLDGFEPIDEPARKTDADPCPNMGTRSQGGPLS
jgi:hypothetical protein